LLRTPPEAARCAPSVPPVQVLPLQLVGCSTAGPYRSPTSSAEKQVEKRWRAEQPSSPPSHSGPAPPTHTAAPVAQDQGRKNVPLWREAAA
jgi:hypothetical protein